MDLLLFSMFFFLFFVGTSSQQGTTTTTSDTGRLQPWVSGLIAVVCFLFLSFLTFVVYKVWCEKRSYNEELDGVQVEDEFNQGRGEYGQTKMHVNREEPVTRTSSYNVVTEGGVEQQVQVTTTPL
uniref:PDZK1-interacting protein 1-like n=1 Tax=Myxine glutinosa TaxID=7769 RepID=UPI00358FA9D8